jgi:hypothetical protein
VIEWQNVCPMCGIVWLDHKRYFWCASCVEWLAERRWFIDNDAACKWPRQMSSASTRELWGTVQHGNI